MLIYLKYNRRREQKEESIANSNTAQRKIKDIKNYSAPPGSLTSVEIAAWGQLWLNVTSG